MKLLDLKILLPEEHEVIKDALYWSLNIIKAQQGENEVTKKLRQAILIIGEAYNE